VSPYVASRPTNTESYVMSSDTIPETMQAVVQNTSAREYRQTSPIFSGTTHPEMKASVQEVKVPQLDDNDVLVRVKFAAQVSRGVVSGVCLIPTL
jgi:hypothetical protein